ncbi:hypothetical protein POTOM_031403 [Populus tomentosa]|uniref:AP2/ERF domain-containing protein n=1 Tax=Populus tomentosa TaxID=118781 RepID=A0A8X7ZCK6_POPTO|nr:hypothetical protein POTOM_031403 [Populus tomentosa]
MARKRKAGEGEEEMVSNDGNVGWDQLMEEAESLHGVRRARKRYLGEAARAYDEAACLLRGANTRTNFWPCSPSSHSKPALPPKIVNLLLLGIKARHNSLTQTTTFPVNQQEQEAREQENQFDHFFEMPGDISIVENSDTASSTADTMTISDHTSGFFESRYITEDHGSTSTFEADDSWSNVDGSGQENKAADALSRRVTLLSVMSVEVIGFEKLKEEYETCSEFGEIYLTLKDENHRVVNGYHFQDGYLFRDNKLCISKTSVRDFLIWEIHTGDMGLINFQFDDALGSSFYHSPFDIAQEIMEPMEQEHHGDEPPMIREIMKRWKHERKFSASLYAYNGVSECLRLAFRPGMPAVANGGYELPSNLGINNNNNEEEKRRDDMGKDAKEEVQEEVEIPRTPTEKGSSSSSSSFSKEDGDLSLWSSLDLPPICFNNI